MAGPLAANAGADGAQAFVASLARLPPTENAYVPLLDALVLTVAPPLGAWWDRFIAANLALWAVALALAVVLLVAKCVTRGAWWLWRTSPDASGRRLVIPNVTVLFGLWLVPVSILQMVYSTAFMQDYYGHHTTRTSIYTIGPAAFGLWVAVGAEAHGLACAAKLSASPTRLQPLHRCPTWAFNAFFILLQLAGCLAIAIAFGLLTQSWLDSNDRFDNEVLGPVLAARDAWRAGDAFSVSLALGALQRLQVISPELYEVQHHLTTLSSTVATFFAIAAALFVPLALFHALQLRQQIREARGRQLVVSEDAKPALPMTTGSGAAGGLIGTVRRRWTSLVVEVAALSLATVALAAVAIAQAAHWDTAVSDPAGSAILLVDHLVYAAAAIVVLGLMSYRSWSPVVHSLRNHGASSEALDAHEDVYDLTHVLRALRGARDPTLPPPIKDPYPSHNGGISLEDRRASVDANGRPSHTTTWVGRSPYPAFDPFDSDKEGIVVEKAVTHVLE